jgi:tRNA (guanine37-N1)-methyltransferase
VRIDVFTIFPDLVRHFFDGSLLGRAGRTGVVDLRVHDLRSEAQDPHRSVDDAPFGGGPGMVLAPEPIFGAVESVSPQPPIFLLSPAGRRLDQSMAEALAAGEGFSLICGRYEGVDQRVVDHLVDGEISVGDVVLAGGEAAALVVVESVVRLLPGVMGNEDSALEESFTSGILEYPQYTRPATFRGWEVPEILLSGDHLRIARWRHAMALRRTLELRPDLLEARGGLTGDEIALLEDFGLGLGPGRGPGPGLARASEDGPSPQSGPEMGSAEDHRAG